MSYEEKAKAQMAEAETEQVKDKQNLLVARKGNDTSEEVYPKRDAMVSQNQTELLRRIHWSYCVV